MLTEKSLRKLRAQIEQISRFEVVVRVNTIGSKENLNVAKMKYAAVAPDNCSIVPVQNFSRFAKMHFDVALRFTSDQTIKFCLRNDWREKPNACANRETD